MVYLNNYYTLEDGEKIVSPLIVEECFDKLFSEWYLYTAPTYSRKSFGSAVGVRLYRGDDVYKEIILSEFPGNCGFLVVSHIQEDLEYPKSMLRGFSVTLSLSACIHWARFYDYGAILATISNSPTAVKVLEEEFGFVVINKCLNPHSNNINSFLTLDLTNRIKVDEMLAGKRRELESNPLMNEIKRLYKKYLESRAEA